jgi:hypothetical protein
LDAERSEARSIGSALEGYAVIQRYGARTRACGVVFLLSLTPFMAMAQSESSLGSSSEGTVVAVEADDLVLDLGGSRGAAAGDVVEIWRPLHLRHPVTGRMLTDRFLIGRLELGQVRPTLSLAKPEGALSRPAQPGDIVVLAKAKPAPASPASAGPTASVGPPSPPIANEVDEEAAQLSSLFERLHNTDVAKRIKAYEDFAAAHPHGRFDSALLDEASALRKLLTLAEARALPPKPIITGETQATDRVVAHEPLHLAVAIHGEVRGVVLHARRGGDATYASQPMTRAGREYWVARVPGSLIEAPTLDYFVEAVTDDGAHAVIGTAETPEAVSVQDTSAHPARRALGQAQIWTDYASFNAKAANDYIFQTEGLMGVRLDDVGIRAVRTGFGVYRGAGGTVNNLDNLHQPPTNVGLTYGYLEGEFGITKYFSFGVRGIVGLDNSGVNGGAFTFLRIGSDLGTNLWFGGEALGGIGVRGIAQFEWNSFCRWPIVLRSEVTDEPAGGDIGVRAIAQVGYRVLPHLVVSARGSYQGRTIYHAGPGGGAAVGYTW